MMQRDRAAIVIVSLITLLLGIAAGVGISNHVPGTIAYETVTATSTILQPYEITVTTGQTQPTTTQTPGQGGWTTIATFTGINDKNTPDFTVPTNIWRITYTVQPANAYSSFSFYLYPSGQTETFLTSVLYVASGTDTTYVHVGPGAFWLDVAAVNLISWTIQIQVQA